MGKLNRLLCGFFLLAVSHFTLAQELKVEGYFLQDSAMLGEKVGYVLKASYPRQTNVLFPDSTYHFGSMEFLGKEIFTTHTQDSTTLDSAVYFLSNFALDSIKRYRLPVFEVLRYDSIHHFPEDATLFLKLTIAEMPDELVFMETNQYQAIKKEINYPYWIIGIAVFLLVTISLFLIFGKDVRRKWRVYKEKRKQRRFHSQWTKTKNRFIANPTLESADILLGLWKSRMQSLTDKPYREWTATEIAEHLEQPELLKDFRKIELIIYANRPADDVQQACRNLENVITSTYEQKIKSLP